MRAKMMMQIKQQMKTRVKTMKKPMMKTPMIKPPELVWMQKVLARCGRVRVGALLVGALLGGLPGFSAQAQTVRDSFTVWQPNGYATVRQTDMTVQSTAGPVRWGRVWDGHEWTFNSNWESLSQSWKNLTGSQSADTTSGGSTGGVRSSSGNSSGSDSGCWVLVDEDWQPTVGAVLVDGKPDAGPMVPGRTSPFNQVMGESTGEYTRGVTVNIDYANLCPGNSSVGRGAQEVEGLRRVNELYLGTEGRYAFNNRTILEKRAVRQLPAVSSAAPYAGLSTGRISLVPETNPKGFRWQERGGDWIEYNTQGQMVAKGDANNNTIWLVRDSGGLLRGVVDGNGRVVFTLHYTGGLITEVRDYPIAGMAQDLPARSVKYDYDERNRLTQVTDVRGYTIKYEYDVSNHITKITDQENQAEVIKYTGDLVKQRILPDGAVWDYKFDYDDVNKQFNSKITGPETAAGRRVEALTYNRASKLVQQVVNGRVDADVKYDTGARIETTTNARGFSRSVTKNEFDQEVAVKQEDGTTTRASYSANHLKMTESIDELGFNTQYFYDSRFNLIQMKEAVDTPELRVTDYDVNSLGQVYRMTRRGRTEANGTVTLDAVWQIEYDEQGQIKKTTDPEGKIRQYIYDRAGNMVSYTDPRNYTTRYEVDAMGNMTKSTDAVPRVRQYVYDKVGNQTKVIDARAKTMLYAYDQMNRRKETTNQVSGVYKMQYNLEGLPVAMFDEDGRKQTSEFDNFLRLTKQIDGVGNVTEYGYNIGDGSNTSLGSLSGPTEIKYPTFTQQQRYDQLERTASNTLLNPNSQGTAVLPSLTDFDKRGLPKGQTDAYGKSSATAYNAFRQAIETKDRLGNKTKLAYDSRGNLIQVTDALNHAYKFDYDRDNRVVKETLPLGQTTTYVYDDTGNLAERVDPNRHKTVYTFDKANRLTEVKQYKDGTTLVRTITYTRDDNDNLVGGQDTDHTLSQTASSISVFDDANRKTTETVTYPGGYTMSYGYGYSLAGYKTRLTWPDGTDIGYGYTQHGVLESVTIPGEGTISVNQFKWNVPEKITLPGGTIQSKTYDGVLNLESFNVKTPGQQTLLSLTNTYGKVLELKQGNRTDNLGGNNLTQNKSYSYDDEIRLTQAAVNDGANTAVESFTLDGVGNRIVHSRQTGDWIYDENNRLKKRGSGACGDVGTVCYEYDESGNTTKKTEGEKVTQFLYNPMNQLVAVTDVIGQLVARYGYDSQFRRLWKEQFRDIAGNALVQAKRTYFLYSDEGLIGESVQNIVLNADQTVTASGSAAIFTQYGPRPAAPFTTGVLFVKTKNSNDQDVVAYYQHDHLNTSVQATDKLGNVVWAASYEAFGKVQITTPVAAADRPTIVSNLRLPGQYQDGETGLHYNYFRDYDPSMGRYLQSDPIGLGSGINIYVYVGGNPLSLVDSLGLRIEVDPVYRKVVDRMRSNSKRFAKMYDDLDKRPGLITIKCRPGPEPKADRSPADGRFGYFPPAFNIGIDSNITDYNYPDVDGARHSMTVEQVIAHEMSHPYMNSYEETGPNGVIASENEVMNELSPNGIRRTTRTDMIFKPKNYRHMKCECEQ
jgi:RHS repeat-associated protein